MRKRRKIHWWVFLPLLLIFIAPAWVWLGDYLGYDLFPAPDAAIPRYSSELLGNCYYIVAFTLAVLVFLPASFLALLLGGLLGYKLALGLGVIIISSLYSGILFFTRKACSSRRHPHKSA